MFCLFCYGIAIVSKVRNSRIPKTCMNKMEALILYIPNGIYKTLPLFAFEFP